MIVTLDTELIKYTNFENEIKVEGRILNEALLNLFEKFPQLYAFLVCNNGVESDKTSLQLNGEYLLNATCLKLPTEVSDIVHFGRDIPEGAGPMGKMLVGAAMIALAVATGPIGMGATAAWMSGSVAMGVGMMGASLVLGGLGELMVGTPNLPTDGKSSSNTYTFSGIKNSTVSGTPIPLIYGRHRTGGHILNAYVDVPKAGGDSFLYAQFGLSEGVIDNIDYNTIEINGRNARDFDDVSAFWRVGEADPAAGTNGTLFSLSSSYNTIQAGIPLNFTVTTTSYSVTVSTSVIYGNSGVKVER